MKRIVIALLVVVAATSAQATTIFDIQTGAVVAGDSVSVVGAVVTGVRYNGFFAAEAPYGVNQHIWVYTGSVNPSGAIDGDVVDIIGNYVEHYGLSEINASAGSVTIVGPGTVPNPIVVPAAILALDSEPYESCLITVPDEMTVSSIFSFGEWEATAIDGSMVRFDDYWYNAATVVLGDCYSSVTGILNFSFGNFKLEVLVAGITPCAVPAEEQSFGAIKALFR